MDIFSTRELAFGTWLCILAVIALSQKSLRDLALKLIRQLFAPKLGQLYAISVLYIALIVVALSAIGLWDLGHLKSAIIWALFVAFLSLVSYAPARWGIWLFQKRDC